MNAKITRDLTTLEYIILGLLGIEPQSGYSIIGSLENGVSRWKASPGAVYPALKRLEQHEIILSKLEVVSETRSRKMYSLTPEGEDLLHKWLTEMPETPTLADEHDLMLIKFLFAEPRLTREECLTLLDNYEKHMQEGDAHLRILYGVAISVSSTHQKLIYEATLMERIMRHQWIKRARRRLLAADKDTAGMEDDLFTALSNSQS